MSKIIEEISQLKFAEPFVPFKIRTFSGKELPVYTTEHINTLPGRNRVIVFALNDTFDIIKEASIDAIEPIVSRK